MKNRIRKILKKFTKRETSLELKGTPTAVRTPNDEGRVIWGKNTVKRMVTSEELRLLSKPALEELCRDMSDWTIVDKEEQQKIYDKYKGDIF